MDTKDLRLPVLGNVCSRCGLLQDYGAKEIPSKVVGEWVMEGLHLLDEVAYVRFASVYRQFKDVNEFMAELKSILDAREDDNTAK